MTNNINAIEALQSLKNGKKVGYDTYIISPIPKTKRVIITIYDYDVFPQEISATPENAIRFVAKGISDYQTPIEDITTLFYVIDDRAKMNADIVTIIVFGVMVLLGLWAIVSMITIVNFLARVMWGAYLLITYPIRLVWRFF